MLVQALADYADRYLRKELENNAFEEKPVHFSIEINEDGTFLSIREYVSREGGDKDSGRPARTTYKTFMVPKSPVNRNTGVHPMLGCDAIQYVAGPAEGVWTRDGELEKHTKHHNGFVQLMQLAASETEDIALQSCTRFYSDSNQLERAQNELIEKKASPGALVTLAVRPSQLDAENTGGPVILREGVRDYWRSCYSKKFEERHKKGGEGICLISGKHGPIAVTHEKIKGTQRLGGQPSGVSLMSFDKGAFRSYGWDQNQNSPVSPERAAAYVLALNDLLKPGEHRQGVSQDKVLRTRSDYGGVGFLYWTRFPEDDTPWGMIENPNADEVAKLLRASFNADSNASCQANPNDFYLVAVSGNGGRLVVRDWIYDSLENVHRNMREWFCGLQIADVFQQGQISDPPRLYDLLTTLSPPRADIEDKMNAGRIIQMIRRALFGKPLGNSILDAALRRLRAEPGSRRFSPARLGIIRLCLNDSFKIQGKEDQIMSEELDPNQTHPAYICGRLLAVYDSLQFQQAQSEINVTVADRYYGMASTYPQLAFPKLETLSRAHLKKLRRGNQGAAIALSRQIDDLMNVLVPQGGRFPKQLSLEDQGRFAIGFHHQKAEDHRRIQEFKAKQIKLNDTRTNEQ